MLPEVRMARIIDAIGLHQAKKLSCVEAAELLGMSERHFRRLRDAYEERGAEGIIDRRRGRASGRRAGVDEIAWVIEAFRTRYFDFTAKHFHEAVHRRPMADGKLFVRSYTWTKSVLQQRGLITRAPKRSAHRKKRARRPLPGMLVFQDGSNHAWLPQGPPRDLIVTMDDATSAILSAVLVEEEGTASSFMGLKETIAAQGLFCALYTDRGSHYFYTPKAGEPVDKTRLTQVGRALKQLGIEHIPSYCPEGRGRMERLFGTLQSRLPPLMRQEGLASIEAALARDRLHPAPQRPLRGRGRRGGHGLRALRGRARRHPVRPGGARGGERQHGPLRGARAADPRAAPPASLRQGDGACSPIPRWPARDLPRSAPACRLRGGRNPHRSDPPRADCCVSPLRSTACGRRGRALLAPPRPQASIRSGHVMCYKCRTSSRALDTPE
jgi:hypothetical protein